MADEKEEFVGSIVIPGLSDEEQRELDQVETKAVQAMGNLQIRTQTDADNAGRMAYELYQHAKKLDEIRKGMTRPLDDAKKKIKSFFDAPIERLEQAQAMLKNSVGTYIKTLRAENELFDEDKQIKVSNISIKGAWHWKVTDITKVPAEFLMVNTKIVDDRICALGKEGEVIPGITAKRKMQLAVRK